ncbi:MAG: exonuclease domain-containing protein [Anaerolineales bacterium]
MPNLQLPIREARLAVLDVETTGLHPAAGDRVIEIAVAVSQGGEISETFVSLVNPQRPISPGAQRVNGITAAMVADAPLFREIAPDVLRLLDDVVLVGHNTPFDLSFLSTEMFRAGKALPSLVALDTLRLAREVYVSGSYALSTIAAGLGVYVDGQAHRAMADVLMTHGVLQQLITDLAPDGIRTVQDFVRMQGGGFEMGDVLPERVPEPIRIALAEGRMLRISYRGEGGVETQRMVKPLQVLERPTGLYLDAFCQLRQARRTFRLDRIVSMDVVERF